MVASLDYVPDGIQAKQEEILNTIDILSHPFKDIQLYWTLPNPKGKDIK